MSTRVGVLALLIASGCAQGVEPELLACGEAPCTVTHVDDPPRGRMLVCEACAETESAYYARAVEIGCPLEQWPHELCDLSSSGRACDYTALVSLWDRMREIDDCDALRELAFADPCTPPDPAIYWRSNGGCIE